MVLLTQCRPKLLLRNLLAIIVLFGFGILFINIWNDEQDTLREQQVATILTPVHIAHKEHGNKADKNKPVVIQINKNLTVDFWKRDWRTTLPLDSESRVYLEGFEKQCENHDNVDTVMERRRSNATNDTVLCPCVPATLVGRVIPDTQALLELTWDATDALTNSVMLGGHWKPLDCIARRRVAVIIPCRDRESHLRAILVHLHPILQRHLVEYRIFVVEQVWPAIYNKGSSMNVGFLEAAKAMDFDCVIFQDVDLLAEDDRAIVHCGDKPLHYGAFLNKWSYKIGYRFIFGGVVALTKEQLIKINGYSNLYFGWGGEDDDFAKRLISAGYAVDRPPKAVSRYTTINHGPDSANPYNPKSKRAFKMHKDEYKLVGLNSIKYDVTDIILEPLFTMIKVKLKETPTDESKQDQKYFKVYGACRDDVNQTVPVLREDSFSEVSCQHLCNVNANCKAYIYYRLRNNHCVHLGGICRIDHHVPEATFYIKDPPRITTPIPDIAQYGNYTVKIADCPGNDIEGLTATLDECMNACDKNHSCIAFAYAEGYKTQCWLKRGTCVPKSENLLARFRLYTKHKED